MSSTASGEGSERIAFQYSALESVVVGRSAADALTERVVEMGRRRVLLVASNSLSRATQDFTDLRDALGERCVGLVNDIGSHTPRSDVMRTLETARAADADLLVSLGGGSIIDACKVVQLAIDQSITSEDTLLEYAQHADGSRGPKHGDLSLFNGSALRQIAIPTTLSGAEFSNNAGVLNTAISAKEGYRGIDICPVSVIYDAQLSVHTPEWLWFSTAIRSLDHAIEGFCSIESHAYLDAHFLHAMRLFSTSLRLSKQDTNDLSARSLNQQAVWLACCGLGTVSHGASHGIGYILGSLCGVPHGYTSCVMLPAVLAWNDRVLGDRQSAINEALGGGEASAAASVAALVQSLGLPISLREVGIERKQLAEIAARSFQHPVVKKNPRPIGSAADVEEILELAW